MSRYLEEAAEQLRKAITDAEETYSSGYQMGEKRERIASGFAILAAIDKGLLPAEITQDVIRAVVDRHTA